MLSVGMKHKFHSVRIQILNWKIPCTYNVSFIPGKIVFSINVNVCRTLKKTKQENFIVFCTNYFPGSILLGEIFFLMACVILERALSFQETWKVVSALLFFVQYCFLRHCFIIYELEIIIPVLPALHRIIWNYFIRAIISKFKILAIFHNGESI